MPETGYALGIDLGTSNTVAVLRWPDGRAKPLLFDGNTLLPSAVYAEPGQPGTTAQPGTAQPGGAVSLLTGRDAVHSARVDPARYEPNPKRRIDDGSVLLGDTEVPVVDLFAAVLARVLEEARRTAGGEIPATTMTCPAAWAAPRRNLLRAAAARAGLGEVRLVEEPVAAAAYFVNVLGRQVPAAKAIVVHDLGAGTFDASVVARTADGFQVLAVDGRGDIGGLDIDAATVAHLAQLYADRDAAAWERLANPSTMEDRRYRRQLWDDV
ncbi:MAG: Hsp70 family protein, partial [Micromonosporaceae bacterium]|nr:Hsp70 family protein [Micromonosporaceae bacterium]